MKQLEVTVPQIGLIAGTGAMLGASVVEYEPVPKTRRPVPNHGTTTTFYLARIASE